jgi:hypothetical protein
MKYNPEIHHRRSVRLKGYDYSQEGAYFVTICAQNRECIFKTVENGEMILNEAGEMIKKWWLELQNKFINFGLNQFIIMPNHFHGIIVIQNKYNPVGADLCVCPKHAHDQGAHDQGAHIGAPLLK